MLQTVVMAHPTPVKAPSLALELVMQVVAAALQTTRNLQGLVIYYLPVAAMERKICRFLIPHTAGAPRQCRLLMDMVNSP